MKREVKEVMDGKNTWAPNRSQGYWDPDESLAPSANELVVTVNAEGHGGVTVDLDQAEYCFGQVMPLTAQLLQTGCSPMSQLDPGNTCDELQPC